MLPPSSPQFLLLLLTFFFLSSLLLTPTHSQIPPPYLKLRLLHKPPTSNPSLFLSSDSHRLSSLRSRIVSGASAGSGQYLVDFRIGSPPQTLLLVADTGSDLVWAKCSACRNCSRHAPGATFLARHSSTFSPFHCSSRACRLAPPPAPPTPVPACNRTRLHSSCRFQQTYADQSTASGLFSHDVATLNASDGREIKVKNLAFGCGFRAAGPSFQGSQGVMGLGRGPISFATQIGRRFGNNVFSYCLMDYTLAPPPSSYLIIGGAARHHLRRRHPTGRPFRYSFTPLRSNPLSPTFYYIQIVSVSVDGKALPIDPSVWDLDPNGNGGTVVDSGTTLTFLPEAAYREVMAAFRRRARLPRAAAPAGSGFDLCVNATGVRHPRLPRLELRLLGGAALVPPPRNYFIDVAEGVKCAAMQAVSAAAQAAGGFSVIGNLMQQGFLFVFDRDQNSLAFSRTGCSLS
ncbi:hypothetical protein ACLOJK_007409 [Asimina triloba]